MTERCKNRQRCLGHLVRLVLWVRIRGMHVICLEGRGWAPAPREPLGRLRLPRHQPLTWPDPLLCAPVFP